MRAAKDQLSVFEVPPLGLGERLAAYLAGFGQILSASSNDLNWGWSFELMLGRKAFISVPNSLDVERQKMPIIIISCKSIC